MSHCVIVETQITDYEALKIALERLNINYTENGTEIFFDGKKVSGFLFRPVGWKYHVVLNGNGLTYDNYKNSWGRIEELNKVTQFYGLEKAKMMARAKRYKYHEVEGENGEIKLIINAEVA